MRSLTINLSYYNTIVHNIEKYNLQGSAGVFYQSVNSFPDYSLITIILSICAFELFRRIRIPYSRIVNYLGSATFMIYLLHDNAFAYSIWNTQDWITLLYYQPLNYVLKIVLWAMCVFAIGVAIHEIYIILGRLVKRCGGIVLTNTDD